MMLCPSCQNFRPANNDPCPWCNAPAASASNTWGGQNASFAANQDQQGFANSWGGQNQEQQPWGGPATSGGDWDAAPGQLPFSTSSWQDPSASGAQQLSFSASGTQPAASDNSFWSQGASPDGPPSLLPVPYQGQPAPNSQALMVRPAGFPTLGPNVQAVNSMLPALPDQEAPVFVPPMYTKPRPIIPRYRAISGLISMVIVIALLCGGAGYFAQVTGRLAPLEHFFGFSNLPSAIGSVANKLPVPSVQQTPGPGNNVITSVGLGASIDSQSHQVPVYTNQFEAGQTIYLACSVSTTKAGVITVKWFTNGSLDATQPQNVLAKTTGIADFHISFGTPTQGRADIYWNNDLAESVLFVVEPAAQ